MPLLLALFVRALIQMAITLAVIELADRVLLPLLNAAIRETMKFFGVDEETAKDIAANEVLRVAQLLAVGAVLLRTKMPTKIADRLGFTTKGFNPRRLSPDVDVRVRAARAGIELPFGRKITTLAPTMAEAAKVSGQPLATLVKIGNVLLRIAGTSMVAAFVAAQIIDFGNWNNGAYQKRMQKVIAFISFGLLVPDEEWARSRVASPEVFDKVWNAYRLEGATAISDMYKNQSVPFTRENFIDFVDKVGAQMLLQNKNVSTKAVIAATQYAMVFSPATGREPSAQVALAAGVPVPRPVGRAATGTLATGVLGPEFPVAVAPAAQLATFEELAAKAREVLISFFRSIPGRIIYDIKLVTSYIDEKGVKRVAEKQTQQVGVDAAGQPILKTLTNRIAVIDVYVLTAPGRRTRIDRFVLGPTDAFGLTTGITQLAALGEEIGAELPEPEAPEFAPPAPEAPIVAPTPPSLPVPPPVIPAPPLAPVAPGLPSVVTEEIISKADRIARLTGTRTWPQIALEVGLTEEQAMHLHGEQLAGRLILGAPLAPAPPSAAPPAFAGQTITPRSVTVNVDTLFVRSEPNRSAPLAGTQRLFRGNTFVAVAWVRGDNVAGEDRWWQSQFGNYVWVGGTAEKPF